MFTFPLYTYHIKYVKKGICGTLKGILCKAFTSAPDKNKETKKLQISNIRFSPALDKEPPKTNLEQKRTPHTCPNRYMKSL